MRKAGERDLNPAAQSRANYTSRHNGAHLNVAMQIACSSFLWIRKPAMSGRIKGYYACKAVYSPPITWGKYTWKWEKHWTVFITRHKRSHRGPSKDSSVFLLFLSVLDVGKNVIKYACVKHITTICGYWWRPFRLIIIVAGTRSHAGMDGEKTRGKMLAANDIQHAEHVICMMTTGNFNEAFVFPPPRKPVRTGKRTKWAKFCLSLFRHRLLQCHLVRICNSALKR